MTGKSFKIVFFFCIICMAISCQKDAPKDTLNLKGKVYNVINQELIEKADISIGNIRVQTNRKGEYAIPNLKINTDYFVSIEHPAFVSIVRKTKFTIAKDILTNFPLIPRAPEQVYKSTDSIVSTFKEGGKVIIEPNSFVKKDRSLYKGKVLLRSTFINPKENNILAASPGIFITSDNRPLQTFGMFEIYATTPEGERLDIIKERPIKVALPNVTNLTGNVGLYYLNRNTGLWVRSGELVYDKATNTLLGQVNTISSAWNADQPCSNTLVCIRVQVVDGAGVSKPGYFIGAKGLSYLGTTGLFQTDANGYVNLSVCPNSVFKFVGGIIPCCDAGDIPGTPAYVFCCENGGQIQGPTVDLNTVTLTPPCTDLGQVIMP